MGIALACRYDCDGGCRLAAFIRFPKPMMAIIMIFMPCLLAGLRDDLDAMVVLMPGFGHELMQTVADDGDPGIDGQHGAAQ
jgi:hypothetical protein